MTPPSIRRWPSSSSGPWAGPPRDLCSQALLLALRRRKRGYPARGRNRELPGRYPPSRRAPRGSATLPPGSARYLLSRPRAPVRAAGVPPAVLERRLSEGCRVTIGSCSRARRREALVMIEQKRGAREFWGSMVGIASAAFVATAVVACSSSSVGIAVTRPRIRGTRQQAPIATPLATPVATPDTTPVTTPDTTPVTTPEARVRSGRSPAAARARTPRPTSTTAESAVTRARRATCAPPGPAACSAGEERASAAAGAATSRRTRTTAARAATRVRRVRSAPPGRAR